MSKLNETSLTGVPNDGLLCENIGVLILVTGDGLNLGVCGFVGIAGVSNVNSSLLASSFNSSRNDSVGLFSFLLSFHCLSTFSLFLHN